MEGFTVKKGVARQCLVTKDRAKILQTKILLVGAEVATDTNRQNAQQTHIDEWTCSDTSALNPLREESEMGEPGESGGWERSRGAADGQKDVSRFHSSQTA